MAWLRIDDGFANHPKLLQLTDREFRVHMRVLCYCARYRDPVVPAFREISGLTRTVAERLARAGVWERFQTGTSEPRYVVHDFNLYNGSSVEERVFAYLTEHPDASANDVARAVPGNRKILLATVKTLRENGSLPVPGTSTTTGSESGYARASRPVHTSTKHLEEEKDVRPQRTGTTFFDTPDDEWSD